MGAVTYRGRAWGRHRRVAVLALAVLVALSGAGVLVLIAGAVRTVTAPDRYSSWRGHQFDASVQQAQGPPSTRALEALPATARVDMATFVFGVVLPTNGREPRNALTFAGDVGALGAVELVGGRLPTAPNEFVATRSKVGDHFRLVTLTAAQAAASGFDFSTARGPRLTARLVGVIDGPAGLEDGYEVNLFPASLLRTGDIGISASIASVGLAPGATMAQLRAQIAALPNGADFGVTKAEWITHNTRKALSAQGQAVVILAAIVLVTVVIVLGQLLGRQLVLGEEERTALRAMGYRRAQLVADPTLRAAVPVVVGALGAGTLAYLASSWFPIGFARRVEPHPGRRLDLLVHVVGPVVLAAALLGWVALAVVRSSTVPPPTERASLVERLAGSLPVLQVATALRFAFAPTGRRARSVTTQLVGFGLLCAILVGALTFGANFARLVTRPDAYGVNFDLALGGAQGATTSSPELLKIVQRDPDVGDVSQYGTTTVSIGNRSTYAIGTTRVQGYLEPPVLTGRLPTSPDEVALGPVLARQLHVVPGDRVTLRGTHRRSLRVTGTALIPPIEGADDIGMLALVTGEGQHLLNPTSDLADVIVRMRPDAPAGAAARLARATGADAGGRLDPPPAIVNLHRIRIVPYLVAAAVGLLAVLDLAHLTIVAVRRRRHDLAVLRALGTTPRWLRGTVHWQSTLAVVAVLVPSIPIGVAAGRALSDRFITHLGAHTTIVVPFGWLGLAAAAALVLANLVAALPARRGGRVPAAGVLAAPA